LQSLTLPGERQLKVSENARKQTVVTEDGEMWKKYIKMNLVSQGRPIQLTLI